MKCLNKFSMDCTICVVTTVTAQLICSFAFTYAKIWSSYDEALSFLSLSLFNCKNYVLFYAVAGLIMVANI